MTPKAGAWCMVSNCYPEVAAARRECFAGLLKSLHVSGIRVVGTMKGAALVERSGEIWSLYDNGGEIGLGRVNDSAISLMAPYTAGGHTLAGETVAYRVRSLMAGLPVDWTLGVPAAEPTDAHRAMFGENGEAYPGDEAWSRIVD